MKVIFLTNIVNIGRKDEIKEVSLGFAKNYLLPKKLAKIATPELIKQKEINNQKQKEKLAQEWQKIKEQAQILKNKEFKFLVKVGEKEQLFESINASKILERLAQEKFNISKAQVHLEQPIKKTGVYPVKISFSPEITTEIKIVAEKEIK